jgi:hypothetical protein
MGHAAGSNVARTISNAPVRTAFAPWYESTRVNPTPAIAASIAASAVFTLSRERIAIAFLDLPDVNVHPMSAIHQRRRNRDVEDQAVFSEPPV